MCIRDRAFLAHLDFQHLEALFHGSFGVRHHDRHRVHRDGQVGFDGIAGTAQHLVQRFAAALGKQVIESHVHGSLGAGVAHQAAVQFGHDRVQVLHLQPAQGRGDAFLHRGVQRAQGLAGDDGGGRRFAVAHGAGVGCLLYTSRCV